jgi:hypothetical protein
MFTIVSQGTFTQPATAIGMNINLPSGCDYFKTINYTKAIANAPTGAFMGEWFGGSLTATNDGIRWGKAGSTTVIVDNFQNASSNPSNGFTYFQKYPDPEAAVTGTTITNATPAVATQTNTYSEGDSVVIYNSTGALMYSGMTFTISSVSGSGYTLLGLNSPGSAATAFTSRRVAKAGRVEPRFLYVTGITQAAQGVVTVSTIHSYVVGQKVEFLIPASFGMVQLNNFNLTQNNAPVITAVTAYTFTININTTAFTAFAFPSTTLSPTAQLFATVTSAGQSAMYNPVTNVQTGYNFQYVPFHSGLFLPYMYIPAGQYSPGGQANEVIIWQAYKMETGTINAPVPS